MARLDLEQRDIDTLMSVGVDQETAARFRDFLARNARFDGQSINEMVMAISSLLRAGFTLHEIYMPKK
jgi:hypothetical protein